VNPIIITPGVVQMDVGFCNGKSVPDNLSADGGVS
jgi:hypothetical protein